MERKQIRDETFKKSYTNINYGINRPVVKTVILGGMTTFITIVTAFLTTMPNKIYLWVLTFFCGITYLCFLGYYASREANRNNAFNELMVRSETTELMSTELIVFFKKYAEIANKIIKEDAENNTLLSWDFDTICNSLCHMIYKLLKKVSKLGNDFGVSYVMLIEDKDEVEKNIDDARLRDNPVIKMIAFENKGSQKPKVYHKYRGIYEEPNYCDKQLFINANEQMVIFNTKEEIKANLKAADIDKYNQYIGIPIICDSGKMIGLLQIIAKNKSIIAGDKDEIETVVMTYFMSFAKMFLFFHKVDKTIAELIKMKKKKPSKKKAKVITT